jgi:hypothetical protein
MALSARISQALPQVAVENYSVIEKTERFAPHRFKVRTTFGEL